LTFYIASKRLKIADLKKLKIKQKKANLFLKNLNRQFLLASKEKLIQKK